MFSNTYRGKKVLVTGHTGFKGSWLSAWLLQLGAEVAGYSLGPPTQPCHFELLELERHIRHYLGDIRDAASLNKAMQEFQPEIIFHLAAQGIVRRAYEDPVGTITTNTIGTLNVLECSRHQPALRAVVIITSDKCYRNLEWPWGYRETDILGGEDPYSASKGCAELVAYCYSKSYFSKVPEGAVVATARAGNVIGGGDWAADRIVPDCVRSWNSGKILNLRNPHSTRPWQHVMEPLSGYLELGTRLYRRARGIIGEAYNFGPDAGVNCSVLSLITSLAEYWPGSRWAVEATNADRTSEARLLKLCCDKALGDLNWRPVLTLPETLRFVGEWYGSFKSDRTNVSRHTSQQIKTYCNLARERKISWAT